MRDTLASVCEHTTLPVIADGDTGYGNAVNVKRTVRGYAQAGAACVMIEDQLAPKRCGHVGGKTVVGREEAFARVKAAVDARDEGASRLTLQLNLGDSATPWENCRSQHRTALLPCDCASSAFMLTIRGQIGSPKAQVQTS